MPWFLERFPLGRLTGVWWFDDNDADSSWDAGERRVATYDYTLDALGRRISAAERTYNAGGTALSRNEAFDWVYDELGRLIGEAYDNKLAAGDYLARYTFDDASNRTKFEKDTTFTQAERTSFLSSPKSYAGSFDESRDYVYDDNDRLTSETSGNEQISFGYAGTRTDLVTKIKSVSGSEVRRETYTYGADGKLAQLVVLEGGITTTSSYGYDSMGNRVSETLQIGTGTPIVSGPRSTSSFFRTESSSYVLLMGEMADGEYVAG